MVLKYSAPVVPTQIGHSEGTTGSQNYPRSPAGRGVVSLCPRHNGDPVVPMCPPLRGACAGTGHAQGVSEVATVAFFWESNSGNPQRPVRRGLWASDMFEQGASWSLVCHTTPGCVTPGADCASAAGSRSVFGQLDPATYAPGCSEGTAVPPEADAGHARPPAHTPARLPVSGRAD